jgi:uncharacterized metal-binding protein YceD (DUF177 family)
MPVLKEYTIPFSGLNPGKHEFRFAIGKTFFDAFEHSVIKDGEVQIDITLEKSETMLVFHFDIDGLIFTECDTCMDELEMPISGHYRQIVKFENEYSVNTDDEVTTIPSGEFEINVAPFIFEFTHLTMPLKMSHVEGDCNPEVMKTLEKYLLIDDEEIDDEVDEQEIDPRWAKLKALKNNDKKK